MTALDLFDAESRPAASMGGPGERPMIEQPDPLADVLAALDADAERAGKVEAHYDRAGAELDRLTSHGDGGPGTAWRWSIPANPERDSDLIFADAIGDVPWLVERLRARDEAIRAVLGLAAEWDALPCVHGYRIPNGNDDESQCLSCAALDLLAALASALGEVTVAGQPAEERGKP